MSRSTWRLRDPPWFIAGPDQLVVRHALEQRQPTDQPVVSLETRRWYHRAAPAGTGRSAVLDGQVRHLAQIRCQMKKADRGTVTAKSLCEAIGEPGPRTGLRSDSTSMRGANVDPRTIVRSLLTPGRAFLIAIGLSLDGGQASHADNFVPTQTDPDAPARTSQPSVPPAHFRPTWDLDGLYLWLGPSGAGGYLDKQWDSTFGGDFSLIRVREHDLLGAVGAASRAPRAGRPATPAWSGSTAWSERGCSATWSARRSARWSSCRACDHPRGRGIGGPVGVRRRHSVRPRRRRRRIGRLRGTRRPHCPSDMAALTAHCARGNHDLLTGRSAAW